MSLVCYVLFTRPLGIIGILCSVYFSTLCRWHVMFCLLVLLVSLACCVPFTIPLGVLGMLCSVYSSSCVIGMLYFVNLYSW